MVDDYVHGNALRSAEVRSAGEPAPDNKPVEAAIRFGRAQIATGTFPHTQALFAADDDPRTACPRLIGPLSERDRFRRGLDTFLHGAASRLNPTLPDDL